MFVYFYFAQAETSFGDNTYRLVIMSAPFASKLFENSSNNTDGWDEWDWVDNNNTSNVVNNQQQQQQHHEQQLHQHQQHQQLQYTNQHQTQIDPHIVQSQVIDNATNQFNAAALPPMDQLHSVPTSMQFNTMLANNNHINATAYHHDIAAVQPPTSFSNFQNSNNNFVQSSTNNYEPRPNSAGFVQVENNESAVPAVQNLPPIPARPPSTNNHILQQNAPVADQNENQQVSSTAEVSNSPVSVLDNNSLPPVLPPPSLNQSPYANTNPFKRVGSHAHRTPPPPPPSQQHAPPTIPDTFGHQSQQQPHPQSDTNESIAHNDRNEYLQTGHLSEDGENNTATPFSDSNAQYSDGNGDSLPPPGLSRLVLGEQEASESTAVLPPPGLDRLVTGTEINQSNINLERQADGQDNTGTKVPQIIRSNSQFTSVPTLPPTTNPVQTHSLDSETKSFKPESDRNQYLVAGENVIDSSNPAPVPNLQNSNIQRVVTGLENDENNDSVLPKHQRDINMDGENIEDRQQQQHLQQQQQQQQSLQQQHHQQHSHLQQHQTHQQSNQNKNTSNTVPQIDSAEDLNTSSNYNRKSHSNASSGDESDREKEYYSRSKSDRNKKSEDRRKKRDDSRYETEDTDHSTRERRRSKEVDRYVEKERGYRGRSIDVDENDSRSHRERGDKMYRGEKGYRPPSRDDEDRYEGRYR